MRRKWNSFFVFSACDRFLLSVLADRLKVIFCWRVQYKKAVEKSEACKCGLTTKFCGILDMLIVEGEPQFFSTKTSL